MSTSLGACSGGEAACERETKAPDTHRCCTHHKFTCECVQHCNKFVACLKLCARIEMSAVKNKTSAVMVAKYANELAKGTYMHDYRHIFTCMCYVFVCVMGDTCVPIIITCVSVVASNTRISDLSHMWQVGRCRSLRW